MSDKPIFLAQLTDNGACRMSRTQFKAMWGDGGEMTLDKVMESAPHFDWMFAAKNILSDAQYKLYRALMLQSFRFLNRVDDPTKVKRQRAMALAFYKAYNSPLE